MFRWLENFVQRRRFFEGGLRAAPDGGWGRRGNLFYSFSYILTARRRINKLVIQQVKGCCRLVLVHTVAIAHAVTVTHTVAPHVVTGTVSIRTGVCACGFTHFLFKALGHFIVQGAQLII